MTTTTPPYVRQLDNGYWVEQDVDGRYHLARCHWLVQQLTFCPEPDSIEDTYVIVECGARITEFRHDGASFTCEAGHRHTAYTQGGADEEYARELAERDGHYVAETLYGKVVL